MSRLNFGLSIESKLEGAASSFFLFKFLRTYYVTLILVIFDEAHAAAFFFLILNDFFPVVSFCDAFFLPLSLKAGPKLSSSKSSNDLADFSERCDGVSIRSLFS